MKKILGIGLLLTNMLFAEVSVKSMMDKMDMTLITDINVSSAIDKAKGINMSNMMDKINIKKGMNSIKDMAKKAMDISFSWKDNLNKAFETAKKANKRVMVMVEGENCRWCKKMIHRTIGDDKVQKKLAQKYISVRVDREDSEAMKKLPKVRGVPTVFFMDEDKNVIEEVVGYFDVLDFTSYMGDVDKKMKQK